MRRTLEEWGSKVNWVWSYALEYWVTGAYWNMWPMRAAYKLLHGQKFSTETQSSLSYREHYRRLVANPCAALTLPRTCLYPSHSAEWISVMLKERFIKDWEIVQGTPSDCVRVVRVGVGEVLKLALVQVHQEKTVDWRQLARLVRELRVKVGDIVWTLLKPKF